MAAYGNNTQQEVAPNSPTVFSLVVEPYNRGLVRFTPGSGSFLLNGWTPWNDGCGCPCCSDNNDAEYNVQVKANIAIPTAGTAGPISMALAIDGSVVPLSQMIVTPAAVEEFFNIGVTMPINIFSNCCQSVSLVNTSDQSILVDTPLINITRPDLVVTY